MKITVKAPYKLKYRYKDSEFGHVWEHEFWSYDEFMDWHNKFAPFVEFIN